MFYFSLCKNNNISFKKKENFKKYVIFYFLLLINSLQIKNAALPSPKYSGYS